MSFARPYLLALLALAFLIVLLSLLRARQRRRDVAALALWDGLLQSSATRWTTFRYFIDLELLLQLACLLFLVAALAQPIWRGQRTSTGAVAVILDSSASMTALDAQGRPLYVEARERAARWLDGAPTSPVAVLALSERPAVLAAPSDGRPAAAAAIASFSASYAADGATPDLLSLLESVGGADSYERVVLFSDHPIDAGPLPVSCEIVQPGDNVAITAFSVRENPSGSGVIAFLAIANAGAAATGQRVTIRDDSARTSVDVFLEGGEDTTLVVPFPLSRGTQFTASLEADDALPLDDVRYASLARSLELHVFWRGAENRFLSAAIEASLPVTLVASESEADLTVAYDTELATLPSGNALLVHTSIPDLVELGAVGTGGFARRATDASPLLDGVEPEDIYVERIRALEVSAPHVVLLTAGESILVAQLAERDRSVLLLNSDLYGTNLAITVDFPLLVRNYLASIARLPGGTAFRWNVVGRPIDLSAYGPVREIVDPSGRRLPRDAQDVFFAPDTPGAYQLLLDQETLPLSVNVDPGESTQAAASSNAAAATSDAALRTDISAELWPYAAAVALALLLAEAVVASGVAAPWRKRRAA